MMISKKLSHFFIFFALLMFLSNATFYPAACAITEEEANKFARQSYEKALSLSRSSNSIDVASMYFINALSFNPGRIDIISAYANMIIKRAEKDFTFSNDTLDALDDFLSAQIMTVKPDDIQKIIRLRETVSKVQESLANRSAPRSSVSSSVLNTEREIRKYKEKAEKSRNLKDYIQALQAAQTLLDNNGSSDPDASNTTAISEKLQAAMALSAGISQIENLLSMSEKKGLEPLQMYYLQLSEASIQQLAAIGSVLPVSVNEELLTLKNKVEKQVEKVSDARSNAVLIQINREYEDMKRSINLMDTEQKKIDAINAFMQDITEYAQQITSQKAGKSLRILMQNVQQQMMYCREEQEKRYSRWAIGEIKDAVLELNGLNSSQSSSMSNIMIAHFADIDTRYLNFGAQNRFNSVYVEYYQKMNNFDKEATDIAMASGEKRKLSDF